MKKRTVMLLTVMLLIFLLPACGQKKEEPQPAQIPNPWSQWDTLEEAEKAVGFSFGLPEAVAEQYTAAVFRTMNGELLEVIYRDGEQEIRVRKQPGEGQDLSGDYTEYENCRETERGGGTVTVYTNSGEEAVKLVISHEGCSWSVTAPVDCSETFLNEIFGE